jgi:hypothetical protein
VVVDKQVQMKQQCCPHLPATLTRQGVKLPLTALDLVAKALTITPLAPPGCAPSQQPIPFKAYVEAAGALYVPRFSPLPIKLQGEPPEASSCAERLVFAGTLRTTQQAVVQDAVKQCKNLGGGMLVLPTGFGKTVCALYIACVLGVKTLVLAHKSFLLDQWAERIAQYIPAARVGRIQRDTVDVQDKDIILGMLQSISQRDYDKAAFDGIGLTIVDEVRTDCWCLAPTSTHRKKHLC